METISLCMIVRDEEKVIGRCLESVADLVDEIVLVDTGSLDQTKAVAAKYTDQIYDYEWMDDFAAARNYSFSKAKMSYVMWLDADDILLETDREKLRALKGALNPSIHTVMMKYNTAFDSEGNPTFSYYRERLLLRSLNPRWQGAVHEAVTPIGNTIYSDIAVTHRKLGPGDPDRNLRIFEKLIARGEQLDPRQRYYYARELYYHARYGEAAQKLREFLDSGEGWVENCINACTDLANCLYRLDDGEGALRALFRSFAYDAPRAETCCSIGAHFLARERYPAAAFWYELALERGDAAETGGFINLDAVGYLPCIQLCVCYDRMGDQKRAAEYNERAAGYKPNDAAVQYNRNYFAQSVNQ